MAETLGVVGSIVGVAGFAGQLVKSSKFLYDFFKGIRDAPDDVRKLLEELEILGSIFGNIQNSFTGHDLELEMALKYCEQRINELIRLIKASDPSKVPKKRQRLWKQFKIALNNSEIAKHVGNLERAKSMVMQACANITRNMHTKNSEGLRVIENSLSRLLLAHETSMTTANSQAIAQQLENTTACLASSSAQISQTTTETAAILDRLTNDTLKIQRATGDIENAARKLVDDALSKRPRLLRELDGAVERTISHHLQGQLLQNETNKRGDHSSNGQKNQILQNSGCSRVDLDAKWQATLKQVESDHTGSSWVKDSAVETRKILMRNTFFGTIMTSIETVSYYRQLPSNPEDLPVEKKSVSQTTVMFLPAAWLLSKGAVLKINTLRLLGRASCQQNPQLSLSTVNIIEEDSEIFQACMRRDLVSIRTLFDEGRASPYDVDEDGRNLLGYLSFGAKFTKVELQDPMRHFANLFAATKFLIQLGVDCGALDLHDWNPVMMFVMSWSDSSDAISNYEDQFQHLLDTLLMNTKSDPFGCRDALVCVLEDKQEEGKYQLETFPGVNSYTSYGPVKFTGLKSLIRQDRWQISWDSRLLWDLSTTMPLGSLDTDEEVRNHVSFWVTMEAAVIEVYLDAKLNLLVELLRHNRIINFENSCQIYHCIHNAIHQGAETIALLSEHDYNGSGPPWLRHRFKKLILVEAFMLKALKGLLVYGYKQLAYLETLNDLSQHALRHNTRTFFVWKKALSEASSELQTSGYPRNSFEKFSAEIESSVHKTKLKVDRMNQGKPSKSRSVEADGNMLKASGSMVERDSGNHDDSDWETEDSEYAESAWETEEEWEEGYSLDTAVDLVPLDDTNRQMSDSERHTRCEKHYDYDEEYWSHVYGRIKDSNMDPISSEPKEGKLRMIGRIAATFLSSIV